MAPSSWEEATEGYARWAHTHDKPDLCTALAFRLIANAAEHGPSTRSYMRSEYKTYRNDWQLADGQELVRARMIAHLITEHRLPTAHRAELGVLYSDGYYFGRQEHDTALVRQAFEGHA